MLIITWFKPKVDTFGFIPVIKTEGSTFCIFYVLKPKVDTYGLNKNP